MRKSQRLRLGDVRGAFRLLHDCRDVGHDPAEWGGLLVKGLARLANAQLVLAGEIGGVEPGRPPGVSVLADVGWVEPGHRASWLDLYVGNPRGLGDAVSFQRFAGRCTRLISRSREQLRGDGEWYSSIEFNEYNKTYGMDDFIASFMPLASRPAVRGFVINRPVGDRRFSRADRRLVQLFHQELVPHLDTSLVMGPSAVISALPARLRQTLEALLQGDSEKQVALRLGLSRHTIHDYVSKLYRRLGVNSRPELLARFLKGPRPPGVPPHGVAERGPTP